MKVYQYVHAFLNFNLKVPLHNNTSLNSLMSNFEQGTLFSLCLLVIMLIKHYFEWLTEFCTSTRYAASSGRTLKDVIATKLKRNKLCLRPIGQWYPQDDWSHRHITRLRVLDFEWLLGYDIRKMDAGLAYNWTQRQSWNNFKFVLA